MSLSKQSAFCLSNGQFTTCEQHESVAKSALPHLSPFLSEMLNVNKQQWVENYKQLDRYNRKYKNGKQFSPEAQSLS